MENLPLHFCPLCDRHQSPTGRHPTVVTCISCQYRDTSPAKALFGRAEWDACTRPERMLVCVRALGAPTGARKKRLLKCATVRNYFSSCSDLEFHAGLACAEEWADAGAAPPGAVALRNHFQFTRPHGDDGSVWPTFVAACLGDPIDTPWWKPADEDTDAAEVARELFANPFVARVWNPDWFTSTVRDIAAHVYAHHEFGTMPILADALQDAGCNDEQILTHCRANRPHARGCWVLDAILGKT